MLQVLPSSKCGAMPSGELVNDSFRVSLAFYDEDKLREAAVKLCAALLDYPSSAQEKSQSRLTVK